MIGLFRVRVVHLYYKIKKRQLCEIEDFVETHLCKRCAGYFDRAYYVFFATSIKDVWSFLRGTKSDSYETQLAYGGGEGLV